MNSFMRIYKISANLGATKHSGRKDSDLLIYIIFRKK